MNTLAMILLSVALSGSGQLFLRAGARGAGGPWWSVFIQPLALVGLSLWIVSSLVWLMVLRRTPLSYAYCLGSLNYIVVPLAGGRLFNEPISPLRYCGMLLIFAGVLLTIFSTFQPNQT